jgi:hypothetical protein
VKISLAQDVGREVSFLREALTAIQVEFGQISPKVRKNCITGILLSKYLLFIYFLIFVSNFLL